MTRRVLVIKLGALGDFLQALGPFVAIRRHHKEAKITLLTTAPFREMAERCGYFDEVWLDRRPKFLQIPDWLRFRKAHFERVYDLQTSDRSGFYFALFFPGPFPEWSGIARGCSHPHANPKRDFQHTIERQTEQLQLAGIADVPLASVDWMTADASRFRLRKPYVLCVPGGAPHRPQKRWPESHYAALAKLLAERGVTPVLLGTAWEAETLAAIAAACPRAVNLAGATDLFDIAELARTAEAAVGNDTGPMHLVAIAGCPALVLFSGASDPTLCAPRGRRVTVVRREPLAALTPAEAFEALSLPEASESNTEPGHP